LADNRETVQTQLRPLCAVFAGSEPDSIKDVVRIAESNLGMGLPPTFENVFRLAYLRKSSEELESKCRNLAGGKLFPTNPPYQEWIEFMKRCASLALGISTMKINALRCSVIRMLNNDSPLGAALCARSMLEHYACTKYLGQSIEHAMKLAETVAKSGSYPQAELGQLEADIAVFLSGTKHTDEVSTFWKSRLEQAQMRKCRAIGDVIDEVLAPDTLLGRTYAVLCRAVHGEWCSGADLHPDAHMACSDRLCTDAFGVLVEFERAEGLDVALSLQRTMWRLSRPDGPSEASSAEELTEQLAQGSLDGLGLRQGRDYWGSGTEQDPIRFRPELHYQDAFHDFLKQKGISLREQHVVKRENGLGDYVLAQDGREFYFDPGSS